jgi:hypothetical protein
MRKPALKRGMNIFVGCDVAEWRLSVAKSAPDFAVFTNLEKAGYLLSKPDTKRVHFCLTAKGKAHVARVEAFYAAKF